MKITPVDPPRVFSVAPGIQIKDCARIQLSPDEQITFITESGAEYDVARKNWGFYATPSTNARLREFGLRTALVRSPRQRFYIMLVEEARLEEFERYAIAEQQTVICWLDELSDLQRIQDACAQK